MANFNIDESDYSKKVEPLIPVVSLIKEYEAMETDVIKNNIRYVISLVGIDNLSEYLNISKFTLKSFTKNNHSAKIRFDIYIKIVTYPLVNSISGNKKRIRKKEQEDLVKELQQKLIDRGI